MLLANRRIFMGGLGTAVLTAASGFPSSALAAERSTNRLVFVFLRGAMDGLTVFPAYGDPDFERERAGIAMPNPGEKDGILKLNDMFGLHPLLPNLQGMYSAGEMALVHAIASPYRERSHFDAQNLVENGTAQPYGLKTGWLNRSLVGLPSQGRDIAVTITSSMPVMMRGDAPTTSWSPSALPQPTADLIARVERLYAGKPELLDPFSKAKMANASMTGAADGSAAFPGLMRSAATFLKSDTGPRVAFLELGGWDTHAGQLGYLGTMHRNMVAVNEGVAAIKEGLGDKWNSTVVMFVTEFGRTVAMNGSNGTDHGTGGAAFLIGGAVKGGQVMTDWPGLKKAQQHEGRDLKPTADLRSLFKAVLHDHMGVDQARLDNQIFPDSAAVRQLNGLVRV
ncbi:MAG: DUF1501 domain-containing protein [Sphingorhabdus sp.]